MNGQSLRVGAKEPGQRVKGLEVVVVSVMWEKSDKQKLKRCMCKDRWTRLLRVRLMFSILAWILGLVCVYEG